MNRRSVLRAGVAGAATVAATAGSSCAGIEIKTAGGPSMGEDELTAVLQRFDFGMAKIGQRSALLDLVPGLGPLGDPRHQELVARGQELGRKSMRMLYLTGAVRDLPPDMVQDPRVQQRILDAMPEMDDAMLGMTEYLSDLSNEDRAAIKQALVERPELLDDIGSVLARHAEEADVPLKRRLHLRKLVKDVGWRMQRQSPGAVIDEYVEKVRKVEARLGEEAQAQRAIAVEVADQLLWGQDLPAPSQPPLVPAQPGQVPEGDERTPHSPQPSLDDNQNGMLGEEAPKPAPRPAPADVEEDPNRERRGRGALTAGAILLGFGAAAAIGGAVILTHDFGGVFLVTLGAALGVAGLITLLVGAILWANS